MELIDIPDFTGYKIDKEGNVYSCIPKGCRNRFDRKKWLLEPTKLNYRKTSTGYCRVYMRRDSTNIREDAHVHRLVAQIFIPNPNNYPEVNHKDSDPSNNKVENLEWVTREQNLEYARVHGNMGRNELGQFTHK